MNKFLAIGIVAVFALFAGCSSTAVYKEAMARPLPSIPSYSSSAVTYDTSAKVSVYLTKPFGAQLFTALKGAGYRTPEAGDLQARVLTLPDFIVEPVACENNVEFGDGAAWLLTRLVVQVRKPGRVVGDKGTMQYGRPRIFQAYARKRLGERYYSYYSPEEAKQNTAVAIANLMKVAPFREALVRR